VRGRGEASIRTFPATSDEAADRLARAGLMTAAAAHEVKNLVTAIRGQAQLGLLSRKRGASRDSLMCILRAADDMGAWFTSLLDFVRGAEVGNGAVNVTDALDDTIALLDPFFRQHRIRLVRSFQPVPTLSGPESSYRQIFFNLLQNAAEAIGSGGGVLAVGVRPRPGEVEVTIKDSGPGIPPGLSDWIYEPLRSDSDSGVGLGLFVTRKLICELGGRILAESGTEGGAVFTVRLPVTG